MGEIGEMWQRKTGAGAEGNERKARGESRNLKTGKALDTENVEKRLEKTCAGLPAELREVYGTLDFVPKSAEQVRYALALDINISEINIKLMKLCMLGVVKQESPGYFCVVG